MTTIRDICDLISSRFPEKCAEDWDNPGLQLGRAGAEARKVIVSLELTPDVAEEAVRAGADLIVTHHPFIFRPIKAVSDRTPEGAMLLMLAEHRIGLIAAHTNLDAAPGAIAQKLADDLGLTGRRPVLEHHPYKAYKIVAFVPRGSADDVARAMHAQGAGCVGEYSDVSFRGEGRGYFTCGAASHPAIGEPGSAETVDEVRLEMVVSERDLAAVEKALRNAHPYEELAFDVFRLESDVRGMTDMYGFGTAGTLPAPMRLDDLIAHIKKLWDIPSLRAAGRPDRMISKVGIMNGSGARYMASCRGIDAYITGDCGHHDFDSAVRQDIALIDAGHYDTEKFIPRIIADVLKAAPFAEDIEVQIARSMRNPMKVW